MAKKRANGEGSIRKKPSGRWAFCGCCPRRWLVSLPFMIPPF